MKARRILMAAALLAVFFVISTLLVSAAAPNVNYGTATVDTSAAEWQTSPLNASNPDWYDIACNHSSCSSTYTGDFFLRYDASTQTLYVLGLVHSGHVYTQSATRDFIRIGTTILINDSTGGPGTCFTNPTTHGVWCDLPGSTGFEASIPLTFPNSQFLTIQMVTDGSNFTSSETIPQIHDITDSSQAGPASLGANVTDTFTITESGMPAAATGSVQWSWCYTASLPPPFPLPNGCLPSDPSFQALGGPVSPGTVNGTTTTWTSPPLVPGQEGTYCFYALYTPDSNSSTNGYSPIAHTDSTTECFVITTPTAVTLSSFKASVGSAAAPGRITLDWATGSQINTAGFNVYRSEHVDGPYVRINSQLIPASSDALAGGKYQYQDMDIVPGTTYYYQLEDVELNGTSTRHAPIAVAAQAALAFNATAITLLGLALGTLVLVVGGVYLRRRKSTTS